jgi:hypothetical protein
MDGVPRPSSVRASVLGFLRVTITTYLMGNQLQWIKRRRKKIGAWLPEITSAIIDAGPILIERQREREESARRYREDEARRYSLRPEYTTPVASSQISGPIRTCPAALKAVGPFCLLNKTEVISVQAEDSSLTSNRWKLQHSATPLQIRSCHSGNMAPCLQKAYVNFFGPGSQ